MFVGRERELQSLEHMYETERFQFAVIYGRRRLGKTTLINQFLEGRNAIYYMAVEDSAEANLCQLSEQIVETLGGQSAGSGLRFGTMREALEYVFVRSQSERVVLALDEYPFAARADRTLASTLQGIIDKYRKTSKLMLIVCGSSISYIEDEVLAYKAPLYGRKTGQIRLGPMDFFDAQKFLPSMSAEDRAAAYGLVGGTPFYLEQIDEKKSIQANIRALLLNPSGMLFDESRNLLAQELREPATYNAVLKAIANGAVRIKEIADKTGQSTSAVSKSLRTLQELELVAKETPYAESSSRRSIYRIQDNLFAFWHRFVPRKMSAIMQGKADLVYRWIEPQLAHYMGPVFEEICRQYLWRRLGDGTIPVEFEDLGRWWGTDPRTKSQVEFDIVGAQDKHTALLGECKWTTNPVDAGVLRNLMDRSPALPYARVHFCLFAKNGYTTSCEELARSEGNVTLVSLNDIAGYATASS